MRTFGVVVDAPFLDDHLRLPEAVEDFAIEAFISADGSSALAFGDWSVGSGSAYVKDDSLCLVWATTSFCSAILRNPSGTRTSRTLPFSS